MVERGTSRVAPLNGRDMQYLTDLQRALLEEEAKRENPNARVFAILKRFASISKRVEGLSSFFKGFTMDTEAMAWVLKMYESTPPSSDEYPVLARVVESYGRAQIWLGYFFSLVNSLNHDLLLRRLTSAEKRIRRLELEVERARRIFKEFNSSVKQLRDSVVGTKEEEPELGYFT